MTIYKFHQYIQETYSQVHRWLENQPECKNYRTTPVSLESTDFMSAATQFDVYFPAHFFKVLHALKEEIGLATIKEWVKNNHSLCILDVGCGAGTATMSIIQTILEIKDYIHHPIEIYVIGIDINENAISIFEQMCSEIQDSLTKHNIKLDIDTLPMSISEALPQILNMLNDKLSDEWKQPNIPQLLIAQVNLVAPLSEKGYRDSEKIHRLQERNPKKKRNSFRFGQAEALTYENVFSGCKIDHVHIITIGTDNKDDKGYLLEGRVEEMGEIISETFLSRKHNANLIKKKLRVKYRNPRDSRWFRKGKEEYSSNFSLAINKISNQTMETDEDWNKIISLQNLKLAWVRARHNLLEGFHDEVEIRIFEQDLDRNLNEIREKLINYKNDIIPPDEIISFSQPKSKEQTRPRGLTRFEEEILCTAIIQCVGNRWRAEHSYGYSLGKNNQSEYLYNYWWKAYQKYIKDAILEAQQTKEGFLLLQLDISRFFEKIIQQELRDLVFKEIKSESARVSWLISNLVLKNLDKHEDGLGIVQGSIGSGFFANVYLSPIHDIFDGENRWNAKLFRYVDDMIIILPNPNDYDEVIDEINRTLKKLGLDINEEKTQKYTDVGSFEENHQKNNELDSLHERYTALTELLWIGDESLRRAFENAHRRMSDDWWNLVSVYKRHLQILGIFISKTDLSRKIYKYLFNEIKRNNHLSNNKQIELTIPPLTPNTHDSYMQKWLLEFTVNNIAWIEDVQKLRDELIHQFDKAYELISLEFEKSHQRQLRFAITRLSLLGLKKISEPIFDILKNYPWILRDSANIIQSLAENGIYDELWSLFEYYRNSKIDTEISDYIRALIIKYVRYTPNQTFSLIERLVEYAIDNKLSLIERLMATETLLYIQYQENYLLESLKIKLQNYIRNNKIENKRLYKNFILLVGQVEVLSPDYSDLLIKNTVELLDQDENLFDYIEPDVLKDEFYGYIPSGLVDEEHGS